MKELDKEKQYAIDFSKIKKLEDVKLVLVLLDLKFKFGTENQFNLCKHILKTK